MSVLSNNFIINTEAFILEIKSRPAIWDSRDSSYNNTVEKQQAWEDICELFINDFQSKSESEKSAYGNELRKKWKNLRDSFTREANRIKKLEKAGNLGSLRRKYMYYDLLSFLTPVCGGKSAASSENQEDSIDKSDDIRTMQNDPSFAYNPQKRIKLVDDQKLLNELSNSIINISRVQEDNNDSDRQFLLSMLPDFKQIPQSSKLIAKVEIMSIIHKYTKTQEVPSQSEVDSNISYEYADINKILKSEEPSESPANSETSDS